VGYVAKWKAVRVRQEVLEEAKKEVEKSQYPSLSEFVSEAIRLRLRGLAKKHMAHQLLYTPRHIWVRLTPEGSVKLGVSDYFESHLRGIVYVGDFEEGDNVSSGEPFGTIETVAWWPLVIHDLISPIDGKIVKVNKAVIDDPYILNGDPHQWMVEVQPNDPGFTKELNKLLSFEEYKKLTTKLEGKSGIPSESFRWLIKQKAREYRYDKEMENRRHRAGSREGADPTHRLVLRN